MSRVKTCEAKGVVLDWLIGVAVGTKMDINGYGVLFIRGSATRWEPQSNMAVYDYAVYKARATIAPEPFGRGWRATIPTRLCDYHGHSDESPSLAFWRALAVAYCGQEPDVPDQLTG